MSETPQAENPFAGVTWPESYQQTAPDAVSCSGKADSSADSPSGGVSTAPPASNRHSDAIFVPAGWRWSTEAQALVRIDDESAPATGTEAQVCADIAKRQRRGLAKYGKTVIGNGLSFAEWLQHFYEELLDGAIYAKRILTMNHEPENETDSDGGADGVLPDSPAPVQRHRKPGAGRKAKPCPGCGTTKSIGSTVKNGIPTRRCRQCGFVVQTYPHLANAAKAPAEMA